MNQIIRINIGPDTLQGRLPNCRVARTSSAIFHISGAGDSSATPPRIWIDTENETLYWVGEWSDTLGLWVVKVNSEATEVVGSEKYALSVAQDDHMFIIGEGVWAVFASIVTDGGTTGGTAGMSLESRLEELEDRFAEFAELGMFDPEGATDYEMREQVQRITNLLRGTT